MEEEHLNFNFALATAVQPMKYSRYMREFAGKGVVCSRFYDIAFVYHAIRGDRLDVYGVDSLITSRDLERHSLSEGLLRGWVFQKLESDAPLRIEPVVDVLNRLDPEEPVDGEEVAMGLSMCSAPKLRYPAAALMYPHFAEAAKAAMQGSFFVLPSSVDEVLLMPAKDCKASNLPDLEQMVQCINRQEVKPRDQLSDLAFFYNAKTEMFTSSQEYKEAVKSIGEI